MAYTIGSQKGQQIANSMKAGSTYQASDGSSWTKNANGTVTVIHNGVVTQNALPGAGVSNSGVSTPQVSSPSVSTPVVSQQPATNTPSVPSGFTGSANSVKTYDSNQSSIVAQMNANSKAWHTAPDGDEKTVGTKQWYAAENQKLSKQLGKGVTFDPRTGYWSGSADKPQEEIKTDPADQSGMLNQYANLYGSGGSYSQALTEQKAANNAAVQKAVNDLEAQKTSTNQSYSDLFRQLYINKMNSQKNLDQQLAAQGVTGGMAESNRLGVEASYSEALRQGEQGRLNAISGLDKAITDTRLTGDIENAQAAADSIKEQTNSYANALLNLIGRNDTLAQQKLEQENAEKSLAYSLALQMLQNGSMPSDTLLGAAGIGAGDAQTILGQSTKSSYTAEQAAMALAAAKNGQTTDAVRAILEGYFGMPMESVLAGQTEKVYTAEQVSAALAAAKNGSTDTAVRTIIESYFGLSLETVLAGQTTGTTYTDSQASVAVTAAAQGNRTDAVRAVIEGYYGLPMEVVLAAYGY